MIERLRSFGQVGAWSTPVYATVSHRKLAGRIALPDPLASPCGEKVHDLSAAAQPQTIFRSAAFGRDCRLLNLRPAHHFASGENTLEVSGRTGALKPHDPRASWPDPKCANN